MTTVPTGEASRIASLLPRIAEEYALAWALDSEASLKLWEGFASWNLDRADRIGQSIDIIVTDDPEPYATSADQSADIIAGRFLVSRAHCDHPVWTVDENVAFRIIHDIEGHHAIGAGFDRRGEILVYVHSLAHTPVDYWPCLFTESIGQLAYAVAHGDFGIQKAYVSAYATRQPAWRDYDPDTDTYACERPEFW